MKPNIDKIKSAIEALPICPEGKDGVTKLVEEIMGRKIVIEPATFSAGDRFKGGCLGDSELMLCQVGPGLFNMIGLRSGNRYGYSLRGEDGHITGDMINQMSDRSIAKEFIPRS